MKKLILLLFIPLVSFSQLTLETMSNINDAQSFKRAMIENGFSVGEVTGGENSVGKHIKYEKMGGGEIPEIIAHYTMYDEDEPLFDEKMMFIYTSDYRGESVSHRVIYDQVKSECEFLEVREHQSLDVAFYKCQYVNPPKELLDLQAYLKKELPDSPNIDVVWYEVGFNKSESLHLIHFPITNKANSTTWRMLKTVLEKQKLEKLDALVEDLDSIN